MTSSALRVLFLLFMPIVTAELLTGSTPLPALVSVVTLPLLLGLYGTGAILVREVTIIWKKGWPTMLALGAAYGIVEEGLDVKTWFNPNWPALGILGSYGRWLGVNWVWALELTIFHAIFSIGIPVAMTKILWPETSNQRWLGKRKLIFVVGIFLLDVFVGFLAWPYFPSAPQYLAALVPALLFVVLAKALPASMTRNPTPTTLEGRSILLCGFFSTMVFFVVFWVLPSLVPPAADVALALLLCAIAITLARRHPLSNPQLFAAISGAVGFLIAIALLSLRFLEGPPIVAIAYVLLLVLARSRINGLSSRTSAQV